LMRNDKISRKVRKGFFAKNAKQFSLRSLRFYYFATLREIGIRKLVIGSLNT
jgi:hypothetical protein